MSNDLISRSALISRIERERRQYGEDYDIEQILGDIEDTPTAYDVDEVVEQLERVSIEEPLTTDGVKTGTIKVLVLKHAVEIVKSGARTDDVCDWEAANGGEFIQNPHTKRLYSNEPSMKNVYCNTCGKKIKAGWNG